MVNLIRSFCNLLSSEVYEKAKSIQHEWIDTSASVCEKTWIGLYDEHREKYFKSSTSKPILSKTAFDQELRVIDHERSKSLFSSDRFDLSPIWKDITKFNASVEDCEESKGIMSKNAETMKLIFSGSDIEPTYTVIGIKNRSFRYVALDRKCFKDRLLKIHTLSLGLLVFFISLSLISLNFFPRAIHFVGGLSAIGSVVSLIAIYRINALLRLTPKKNPEKSAKAYFSNRNYAFQDGFNDQEIEICFVLNMKLYLDAMVSDVKAINFTSLVSGIQTKMLGFPLRTPSKTRLKTLFDQYLDNILLRKEREFLERKFNIKTLKFDLWDLFTEMEKPSRTDEATGFIIQFRKILLNAVNDTRKELSLEKKSEVNGSFNDSKEKQEKSIEAFETGVWQKYLDLFMQKNLKDSKDVSLSKDSKDVSLSAVRQEMQ